MFGNIGTALRPGSPFGGSSPNSTGTNIQASSNPAGGLFGLMGVGARNGFGAGSFGGVMPPGPGGGVGTGGFNGGLVTPGLQLTPPSDPSPPQPSPTGSSALHSSGLPNQAPAGVNSQLWSSILQHLQQTNYGAQARGGPATRPQSGWRPLPSTMQPQPMSRAGGSAFMGAY